MVSEVEPSKTNLMLDARTQPAFRIFGVWGGRNEIKKWLDKVVAIC